MPIKKLQLNARILSQCTKFRKNSSNCLILGDKESGLVPAMANVIFTEDFFEHEVGLIPPGRINPNITNKATLGLEVTPKYAPIPACPL